jgi:hypothetical protein
MNAMNAMDAMVNKYNAINGDAELELSYSFDNSRYHELLSAFEEVSSKQEMIQHMDVYHVDNTRRTMIFVDGVNQKQDSYMKKQLLAKPMWIEDGIKMKLNKEIPVSQSTSPIKFIRAKLRIRFILDDSFDIEVDLIKNIDKHDNQLKLIKDRIFKMYTTYSDINPLEFDELKVETEFKTKKINQSDIARSITLIKQQMS